MRADEKKRPPGRGRPYVVGVVLGGGALPRTPDMAIQCLEHEAGVVEVVDGNVPVAGLVHPMHRDFGPIAPREPVGHVHVDMPESDRSLVHVHDVREVEAQDDILDFQEA